MATLTVRNLDDELKRRLRLRAAEHGRSMEAEARAILGETLMSGDASAAPTSQRVRALFAGLGNESLALPGRADAPRAATLPE